MGTIRSLLNQLIGVSATNTLAAWRSQWRNERKLKALHSSGCKRARRLATDGTLKLHLGCGNIYKPGWVNVDAYYCAPCTPDVTLDLRQPLPFPDGSCSVVYSEHFFEHVPYPEGASANLSESYRVLRPGGLLSMGVPDPVPVVLAWLNDSYDPYLDYFHNHFSVRRHLNTKMEAVNWLFKQGGEHQFIYDFPSLEKMLQLAGFERIVQRQFDAERDSESRRHGTIYVDAFKPEIA